MNFPKFEEILIWFANALGFSERIGGINFEGAFSPNQQIADRVDEGNQVTLQKGDKKNPEKVIGKGIKFEGAGFTGVICGFEPPVLELEGMKIGTMSFVAKCNGDNQIFLD